MWEQIEPFFRILYILPLKIEIVNGANIET